MTKNGLIAVLSKILGIAAHAKTKIVLMGGIAASIIVRPRATYDIDGLVVLDEGKIKSFLALLSRAGFKFEKHPIRQIAGLPFMTFYYPPQRIYVDLFLAQSAFQKEAVRRAKKVKVGRLWSYVISPEDLILVKLIAGREKDLQDVREIILEYKETLDFAYLRKWAQGLNLTVFLDDELKSLGLAP